jgi:undecaprenyl-diphosphatase
MISKMRRISEAELPLCLLFNRVNHVNLVSRFFAVISRLGNGVFWYAIMAVLPVIYGISALWVSVHMLLVGVVALLIYKALKKATGRARPYQVNGNILQNVPALDLYSFPSGHTLHAFSFSVVLTHYYPEWGWLVWPFTLLVAFSRLILGLHYPSDVLVGAGIGLLVSLLSFPVAASFVM